MHVGSFAHISASIHLYYVHVCIYTYIYIHPHIRIYTYVHIPFSQMPCETFEIFHVIDFKGPIICKLIPSDNILLNIHIHTKNIPLSQVPHERTFEGPGHRSDGPTGYIHTLVYIHT